MKKVFMTLAVVAAMSAAAACSCNNNSKKAECCEAEQKECCEAAETKCCGDTTKCADCPCKCDSTATVDSAVVAE